MFAFVNRLIFKHNLRNPIGWLGFFNKFIYFITYYGIHVTWDMYLYLVEMKTVIIYVLLSTRAVIGQFAGRIVLYSPLNFKVSFPRAQLTLEI